MGYTVTILAPAFRAPLVRVLLHPKSCISRSALNKLQRLNKA